jgi:predicted HNH restriction endonuclease
MPTAASLTPPPFQQYVNAFRSLHNLTDHQIQMLRVHYYSPERTITAPQLAQALGYSSHSVSNAQYGRLARLVGEQLGYNPEPERLGTLVRFEKRHGQWHWRMRPEVAQALEILRWVEGASAPLSEESAVISPLGESELPDLDLLNLTAREGRLRVVEHLRRERNRTIIQAKKKQALHTTGRLICEVCGFDFERVYGPIGRDFCEVHHKVPLATAGTERTTTLEDLAILCSNCYRMIHRTNPFKSIEELKRLITSRT